MLLADAMFFSGSFEQTKVNRSNIDSYISNLDIN